MIAAVTGVASAPPPALRRTSSSPDVRAVEAIPSAPRERRPSSEQETPDAAPARAVADYASPAAALEPVSTQAVLLLRSTGESVPDIADAYGLSPGKVRQMLAVAAGGDGGPA